MVSDFYWTQTSPRQPIENFKDFSEAHMASKFLKKSMAIYGNSVNFFRIFGANVRLGKRCILETQK